MSRFGAIGRPLSLESDHRASRNFTRNLSQEFEVKQFIKTLPKKDMDLKM